MHVQDKVLVTFGLFGKQGCHWICKLGNFWQIKIFSSHETVLINARQGGFF